MTQQNQSTPPEQSESLWEKLSSWFKSDQDDNKKPTTDNEITEAKKNDNLQLNQSLDSIERVLYQTDRVLPPCDQLIDKCFVEDAINIKANGQAIKGNQIIDKVIGTPLDELHSLAKRAHRDGIQLIPTKVGVGNYQFMAGSLEDIVIEDNHITSQGLLQGIFGSDGVFRNIIIRNNRIDTQAEHKITINGFLSGVLSNNRDSEGKLLPIYLGPLRLGGNLATGNVWIVSFAPEDTYQYAPLSEIIPDTDKAEDTNPYPHVRDERYTPQNRSGHLGDTNLYAFPLTKFKVLLDTASIEHLLALQTNLDSLFGDWLTRLATVLTEPQLTTLKEAYQAERSVPIGQIKHQALRHYFIQALAKQLGSLVDPQATKA